MRIVIHSSQVYDWQPVPPGVEVTPADKEAGIVRPNHDGDGWVMRVAIPSRGPTEVHISEAHIVNETIHKERRALRLSRKDVVKVFLDGHLTKLHAHPSWVTGVEVHDDGPDEAIARAVMAPHVTSGTISADALEAHVAAYMAPACADDHACHLRQHFGVKS